MLPEGVKSRFEIEEYKDPIDRVTHLARLLEYTLKALTPNSSLLTFEQLLATHATKFSNIRRLDYARITRNNIVHGDARLKKRHVLDAETVLDGAIDELLDHCPSPLQEALRGLPLITNESPVTKADADGDSLRSVGAIPSPLSLDDNTSWAEVQRVILEAVRAEIRQTLGTHLASSEDALDEEPNRPGAHTINPIDGLSYVWVPPGEFLMGAPPEDLAASNDEKPQHKVVISKGFWVGKTPVTVGAYKQFAKESDFPMPEGPEFDPEFAREDYPIVNVTLYEALSYCRWARARLLTEAEWEYVCRAGSSNIQPEKVVRSRPKGEVWGGVSVGLYSPNSWGICDMPGNVFEWVKDKYSSNYYAGCIADRTLDPRGPFLRSGWRTMRGGPCLRASMMRNSTRWKVGPTARWDVIGFRCALIQRRRRDLR